MRISGHFQTDSIKVLNSQYHVQGEQVSFASRDASGVSVIIHSA